MAIHFTHEECRDFEAVINAEWLCTNGLGGYASGTVAGANTRKYHGYLVVAAKPPVQRYVVLSRVEDRVILGGDAPATQSKPAVALGDIASEPAAAGTAVTTFPQSVYDLSTDEFVDIVHPQGYRNLVSFELGVGPVWRYQVGTGGGSDTEAIIEKSITMAPGEDAVVVQYKLISRGNPRLPVKLQLQPMLAGRDFHGTIQLQQRPWWTMLPNTETSERGMSTPPISSQPSILGVEAPECPVKLFFGHNGDRFSVNACWWYNFTFRVERQRGYPDREDLWTPGVLEFTLEPNKPVGFIASTRPTAWSRAPEIIAAATERHASLAAAFARRTAADAKDELLSTLSVAADQFIVQRGVDTTAPIQKKSVIAGYPWFEDWGRDTFIALAGLTLVTGRFDVAKSILATFADHMRRGLLPNRFPDKSSTLDYNTVDASLWFIHAAYQYWRYTGDQPFLTKYLYPKLCEVMERYRDGTDFGIRMDHDGLIRAGDGNHQPTWMDAKIGDWVVTPRHGKPVEINALWYSNLRIMSLVAERAGDTVRAAAFTSLAEKAELVFEKTYFNNMTKCLNDVVGDDGKPDESIRPNQLMAVALPFSPLSTEAKIGVVAACQKLLLTPMGMRTLAPGSGAYHGKCVGDQRARDMAYHQGTAWPWLIGPFVTAYVKVRGGTPEARAEAKSFLDPFREHLKKAGLGSISEIADADAPFTPRGCPAQAWSVGEVLRVYWEDVLNRAPKWPHELEGAGQAPTVATQRR